MVRDIESLIEFLYLKSINSPLDTDKIIVNPKEGDVLLGKTCIINKIYALPNLSSAEEVIDRFKDPYINYSNRFIRFINVIDNDVFVTTKDNLFYFGKVPDNLIEEGNCFDYLNKLLLRLLQ